MGELIDLNLKAVTDADIPSTIARDTETAAAIAGHSLHPTLRRLDFGSSLGNLSGFYEGLNSLNVPTQVGGLSNWVHLIECRHSDPNNNYALQIASSFFDQNLYSRSLNGAGGTSWNKIAFFSEIPKQKIIAVTSGIVQGAMTSSVHGLDQLKIIGFRALMRINQSISAGFIPLILPGGLAGLTGYNYSAQLDAGSCIVRLHPTDSSWLLSRTVTFIIDHT